MTRQIEQSHTDTKYGEAWNIINEKKERKKEKQTDDLSLQW